MRCAVLEWAASGAMWLTGHEGGPPAYPAAPVVPVLDAALEEAAALAAAAGGDLAERAGTVLTERASSRGFRRRGRTSLGGRCRLLRAADGWVAVNLARPEDVEVVPAVVGGPVPEDPWAALARAGASMPAAALAARAQLCGVPSAPLPRRPAAASAPVRTVPLGPRAERVAASPLVVNLSAMWAGPLCAHLLAQSGARVVKVEDPRRPDGSRFGDPWLFRHLNAGCEHEAADLSSPAGRARLRRLLARADVVIEGSRPRALRRLGLTPGAFLRARPGRTWVSVTGYGRLGPWSGRVAFGDDAAVAGGLVAWSGSGPVFCADAIADPVTGVFAALGALRSWAGGGGCLVDAAMRRAVAYVCAQPPCPADHPIEDLGDGRWAVRHGNKVQEVCPPPPVAV